jgi:hypothetical protein
MNVFGFVNSGEVCELHCDDDGMYFLKALTDIKVSGTAAFETGLRLYPPPTCLPLILSSELMNKRGVRVEGLFHADVPLRLFLTAQLGGSVKVATGEIIAILALVKVASPRLVRWDAATAEGRSQAREELKKMVLPPKPISVMRPPPK